MSVRDMQFNNLFYEGNSSSLHDELNHYFDKVGFSKIVDVTSIKAAIVPHAGYKYSGQVASYFYKSIKGVLKSKYVILGFNHRHEIHGLVKGSWSLWNTPFGALSTENTLLGGLEITMNDDLFYDEHSIEVQLPLLKYVAPDAKILPLLVGQLESIEDQAKQIIEQIDESAQLIISSDFSHYLNYALAQRKDDYTIKKILNLDPSITYEEACGADAINLLIYIAQIKGWAGKLLKYANSGDTYGDKKSVVGYTTVVFI